MPEEMFTTVRRGYDPAEVERAVTQAQGEVAELRRRLEAAEAAAESARAEAATSREALVSREAQEPEAPTYAHLGERVGQILSLAEAEAAEIRDRVVGEVEALRKDARAQAELDAMTARMLAEAEERSTTMVADARATADRVRAESERELAAAAQRRDSINAQLSNVRQMLATLSGTSVPGVGMAQPESTPEPTPEPVTEAEVVEAQEAAAEAPEER